ncbi:MAG: hypothetical protein HY619_04480, partial [Thaumarchaeota archaeon]|nr:hypothetical protein [Nitrososphaerota archaeon]
MAWLQPIASLKIVTDDLRCRPSTLESSTVRGGGLSGKFICFSPFETEVYLDWTNLRGSGPNIWLSFIYRMHKWDYRIAKLDEYIEVTPTFEYYKLTIEEKHKIEQTIKQGLASASQAVADYDMMAHDVRRYQEILDYFEKAHRTKDDHILRSLFVDRVDAYTGEGYSLVSMAKRWPTIITDFIRMKSEWTEKEDSQEEQVKRIRAGLDVSMAEATVLRSKDILFREWKKLFLPVVQDRYARVKVIADARKESINEYKEWLKPYIARFRMMRETLEKDPTAHLNDPFLTPGLGIAATNQGARIWIWKPFHPQEFRKSEMIREHKGFVVYPFDDFAKEWM